MKNIIWLLVLVANLSFAQSRGEFPSGPMAQYTPGKLCNHPDSFRYPEKVAYCTRDVSDQEKDLVFKTYRLAGWKLSYQNRNDYKVDHLIPLCAGGSNDIANLWPQHVSVGRITDPIEPLGCEKMAQGRLTQANFVKLILQAKANLSLAPSILAQIQRL